MAGKNIGKRERKRRNRPQEPVDEPTFADFETARRVINYTRRWLEAQGEPITLLGCPIFSHIVIKSSPLCNPALFERSQLASAEGSFVRNQNDAAEICNATL